MGIQTSRHAVVASGLLNGPVDWLATTQRILRTEHPDVVVAIFVGNYAPPYVRDARGAPILPDTPDFFRTWQLRAVAISKAVNDAGAEMYWVRPPPIGLSPLAHAQRLYDGYRTIDGDHFLDSGRVLAADDGKQVNRKKTCGETHTVRSTLDGVHLTSYGARIYGQQIAHDLTARLGVLTAPRPC